MNTLQVKYYFFNVILFITKSYWLFLFLLICIIFTLYDLSILSLLYLLIFGVIFILRFYKIIIILENYLKNKSFFISRLIRYNFIELGRHIEESKFYRSLAFQYILCLSFTSLLLFYSYGIFYLIQHGCDTNKWNSCDNRHEKLIPYERKDGEKIIDEIFIQSLAYFLGFYINSNNDSLFKAGWFHILFFLLICCDVYVQKLENYLNDKIKYIRNIHQNLTHYHIKKNSSFRIPLSKSLAFGKNKFSEITE